MIIRSWSDRFENTIIDVLEIRKFCRFVCIIIMDDKIKTCYVCKKQFECLAGKKIVG